jgi:outer membrane protein insertion porin family
MRSIFVITCGFALLSTQTAWADEINTLPPAPSASNAPWIIPGQVPQSAEQAPAQAAPGSEFALLVTDVQIVGADAELQQIVRPKIQAQPGRLLTRSQLQADVAAILETGLFSNASVSSQENANGLSVTFQVQPITVRSLRLVGAQTLTPGVAQEFFKNQFNQVVRPSALNESIRQINQWYAKNNLSLARVVAVTPGRDGTLTLEVAEGFVSDVQFRFTDEQGKLTNEKGEPITGRTRPEFLRRQIQLQSGRAFRQDIAQQDLQRLVQTGLFTNARVALEGDARQARVVYVLTEARSRGVNVSGGYNDDLGIYGSFNYNDRNFNGVGQQMGGNILVGSRDVQFDGRFVSPYRATEPNKLGYSIDGFRRRSLSRVFDDDIKAPNGDRIREGRFGGGVSVNRPIGDGWNGSLGLNYQRISLRDRDGDVVRRDARGNPLSFSGTGTDDLTTLNFTATKDQRDSAIEPTRGSILTLSTEQSIPIGQGSILSNRLQANFSEYIPVNIFNLEKTQKQPEVFAYNLQAGTTIGDLPPYNAYTLGGPNSVRGYGAGEVGVSRSYILASAEYRFPIYSIIGGAVFADFASDLGTSKSVLGQPGVERGRPGSGFGIGIGLRIRSPFGIFRAGYGINDQGEGRFQIGVGEKF